MKIVYNGELDPRQCKAVLGEQIPALAAEDPDVIYLCGGMMRNGDRFLRQIQDATMRRQMTEAGRRVVIRVGSLQEWNVALGATQVVPYYEWKSERMSFLR